MVELVYASPAHVGRIANAMREADVVECRAHGWTPKQALRQGLIGSTLALTARVGGRPVAMLGLEPISLIEGVGRPWMLGTEEVYRHGRALMDLGPRIIAAMLDSSRRMENVVSTGNGRAIRVLRRWGFTVEDGVRMIGGVPFYDFWMER